LDFVLIALGLDSTSTSLIQLPGPNRGIESAGDQQLSGRITSQRGDCTGVAGEMIDFGAGSEVPNANDVIGSARSQAVWSAKANGHDFAFDIVEVQRFVAAGDVPKVNPAIIAGRGELCGVRRESERANAPVISLAVLPEAGIIGVPD